MDDYDETDPAIQHGEAVLERLLAAAYPPEAEAINQAAIRAGLRWRCSNCRHLNPDTATLCAVATCGRSRWADAPLHLLGLSLRARRRLGRACILTTPQLTARTARRLLEETTLTAGDITHIQAQLRLFRLRLAEEQEAP
jgi:hypothetical protein